MDRRRAAPTRLVNEELETWDHARESLRALSAFYAKNSIQDTVGRVNRLISAWPTNDTLPAEGLDSLKGIQQKLTSGIEDVKALTNEELDNLEDVIERVGVLIAVRRASREAQLVPPGEKRNKRPRASSPNGTPAPPPSGIPNSRGVSITLPPRTSSVGPSGSFRDMKSKKDGFMKQPLQPGRKVAFRPPKDPGNTDENEWIIAIVTRVINAKDGKYEVQDAEPQEDGQPGQLYAATSKSIVPLPDQSAPAGHPAHLSSYPIFPVGSTVLALYPDTSCFYRAEVIEAPTDISSASLKYDPTYKVRFDDDDMPSQVVTAYRVVQCPAHFLPAKANGK